MNNRITFAEALVWVFLLGLLIVAVLIQAGRADAQPTGFMAYLPNTHQQRVEPQPPVHIHPPDGVRCFGLDIHVVRDSTGSYFANCQAKDERGQVVWVQRPDGRRTLLKEYGAAYGNKGNVFVASDGWGYSVVTNGDGSDTLVEPLLGWTP